MLNLKNLLVCITIASVLLSGCAKPQNGDGGKNAGGTPTIKLFANFNPADPTLSDKKFIEQVEAATGVKLEFDVPPSTSYAERMQLMLASGEYPDAILFNSTVDQGYLNAVSQDILIPLNEYVTEEAAPNLNKYSYKVSWDALKSKNTDDIYGIPRTSMVRFDGVFVRQDWLDKIGFKLNDTHTVTVDEFELILKKFTENDPDGNGKNDTFGYLMSADANKSLQPLATNAFGNLGWQKAIDEGYDYMHPRYSKTNPAYKKALEYTQNLYKKGYIDPNAPNMTATDASEKFEKGVGGVYAGFSGHVLNTERGVQKNNPNAKVNYMYIKGNTGELKGSAFSTGFWGHWSITTACKHPENVVKVLEYMLSDAGWESITKGYEGFDYEMVDGVKKSISDKSKNQSWNRSYVRRKDNLDFFANAIAWTKEERARVEPIVKVGVDAMVFSLDNGFTPPIAKEIKYINYTKTMQEAETKIITGNATLDEYNKALKGWYENGGEEYVTQVNEYINKIKK